MVGDANLVATRAMYDALLRDDIEAVLGALAEDVELVVYGPATVPFVGRHLGKQGIVDFFEIVGRHVDRRPGDPIPAVHEYVALGDKIVAIGVDRVRNRLTGQTFQGWWVHVLEFRDGKVARIREFIDTASAHEAFRGAVDAEAGA